MDKHQKTSDRIAVPPTKDGVTRCRFDMFLRLYPNTPSTFPKNARIWTYRGDAFTDVEDQMISNLVRHVIRKKHLYSVIELYDNNYAKDDLRRLVLKINDGQKPENNRLNQYTDMLKNIFIPDFLK